MEFRHHAEEEVEVPPYERDLTTPAFKFTCGELTILLGIAREELGKQILRTNTKHSTVDDLENIPQDVMDLANAVRKMSRSLRKFRKSILAKEREREK